MTGENVKIKICGLSRPIDIEYINEAKPDYCGFIINVPKSIRNTTPDQVRELRKMLNPGIIPVGVFRDAPMELVEELLRDGTIAIAQLHGHENEEYIRKLKTMSDFTVIKAFNEKTMDQAMVSSADYILLDHAGGGTGETFDWKLLKDIRRPFFLAGGLGSDNIKEALEVVQPWAIDLSSKVETDGVKDREKILEAVKLAREYGKKN